MSINPKVQYIRREFIEVYEALKNNVDINIIYNSYENFSPDMHNFIKIQYLDSLNLYFIMINTLVETGTTPNDLRKTLLTMPNSNINVINYIIDSIYDETNEVKNINKTNEVKNINETNKTHTVKKVQKVKKANEQNYATRKNGPCIIDTIVNDPDKSIEIVLANKIFNVYRQFHYSPDKSHEYKGMVELYNGTVYDDQKKALILKIDDDENHNIVFKLELRTKFNFNKFANGLKIIIDKAYKVSQPF